MPATFAISLTFTATAKDSDKAHELAEKIGDSVVDDKFAKEYTVIDVEQTEGDDEDFNQEDDE
jgi:hypothetical protein